MLRSGSGNGDVEIDDTTAGTTVFDGSYSSVSKLTVTGSGAGVNQLTVDFTGGADSIPTGGIAFNGVAGANNLLTINGGTFTTITSTYTGATTATSSSTAWARSITPV